MSYETKKFDLLSTFKISKFKEVEFLHVLILLIILFLSLNLIFQSDSKTLEDKVVNPIIDGIIEVVSKKFNAKLR